MSAVDIGIGHDDDLVVPQLFSRIHRRCPRPVPSRPGHQLVVAVDRSAGLFHVQHLAPQRQDGLETAVPALLGGAACGVTLDDEDFGRRGLCSCSPPACPAWPALSSAVLRRTRSRAFLAASRARAGWVAFSKMALATAGFSSKVGPQLVVHMLETRPLISVLPSLALVWPSNCASCSLTEMAVRPSRTSSPEILVLLQQPFFRP